MNSERILTIPTEIAPPRANKQIKFILGGVVIALAVVYLMYVGIQSTSAYFFTIDELYAQDSATLSHQVRVSGWVDAPTIDYDHKNLILKFDIVSDSGQRLPVVFNGPKPDQMREGAEAIVEGKFDGTTFESKTLLLKCPSRYEGEPEEIQVEAIK